MTLQNNAQETAGRSISVVPYFLRLRGDKINSKHWLFILLICPFFLGACSVMHLRQQLKKITLINFQRWYKSWSIKDLKKNTQMRQIATRDWLVWIWIGLSLHHSGETGLWNCHVMKWLQDVWSLPNETPTFVSGAPTSSYSRTLP